MDETTSSLELLFEQSGALNLTELVRYLDRTDGQESGELYRTYHRNIRQEISRQAARFSKGEQPPTVEEIRSFDKVCGRYLKNLLRLSEAEPGLATAQSSPSTPIEP